MKKQPQNICRLITLLACLSLMTVMTSGWVRAQNSEPRFEKDIVAYEKLSQETPPPADCTMFVGSSTWRLWEGIEKEFEELKAVNRGFGGSTIPDVLRVMHRIVLPYKPARIVFFCGTNDIAGGMTGEATFKNFEEFLKRVWENNPKTDVFFVTATIAPSREKFRDEMVKYNGLAKELAEKTPHLYFVNTFVTLTGDDGKAQEKYFLKDRLHLNKEGQNLWVPVIKKAISDANGDAQKAADENP